MKRLLFVAVEIDCEDAKPKTADLAEALEAELDGATIYPDAYPLGFTIECLAVNTVPAMASKVAHSIRKARQ